LYHVCCFGCFFFFQAEDGIRDATVTGVQTCALPISFWRMAIATAVLVPWWLRHRPVPLPLLAAILGVLSAILFGLDIVLWHVSLLLHRRRTPRSPRQQRATLDRARRAHLLARTPAAPLWFGMTTSVGGVVLSCRRIRSGAR